jgi:penicillin G amidase
VRRWVRVLSAVAAVLVVVLVSALLAGVWSVRRSFPQTEGELAVAGLSGRVEVVRDEYGVPQIYADTPEDLFRAQGFVQAQDRFFEMDFRRHVTAGRLSELFGESTVDTDRFVRTLGWRRIAEREVALLDADARRYLEAFSDGVNAYLEDRTPSELSLEYAVLALDGLDYTPEPWTPPDSLAWLKAMAWDLQSNMREEIDRVLATQTLSRRQIADLYPPYPYRRHPPAVTSGAVVDGVFEQDATRNSTRRPSRVVPSQEVLDALRRVDAAAGTLPTLIGSGPGIGSNAWAVSGAHTSTGRPIMSNDPHLAPTMPGIWYQMGLHCREVDDDCPFDVAGFTFAGLPGVVIGHNDAIAWGFTTLGADVVDLYLEDVRDGTYRYDGRRIPMETRQETIAVTGGDDVEMTVRSTRHGPLISDASEEIEEVGQLRNGTAVAIRSTALDPGGTANAIFGLNVARSWREFRTAASEFEVPSQNIVYADRDGHIGYQSPGVIPIRRKGTGEWPAPGWDPAYDWADDPIPFDALPSVLDPDDGYVVTANQAVIGPRYPYYLGESWSYGYRSKRIDDLLRRERSLSIDDMAQIQLDTRSGLAADLVPYLLDVDMRRPYVREGQRLLQDWDYSQGTDSAAAAFFNVTWRALLERTFHDQLPEEVWPSRGDRWFEVVRRLLERPDSFWWDDVRTDEVRETRDDVLVAAMTDARYEMTRRQARHTDQWRWGHLHRLELVHPSLGTSGVGPVEWLFNRGPVEVPGGDSVVNVSGWSATEDYSTVWASSMRMVVSLADFDDSRWVNLSGASGHAFSSHYADQFELWTEGRTTAWPFSRDAVEAAGQSVLTLTPAPD